MPAFERAAVVGAAGGFGRVLARLLHEDGASVAGVDIAERPSSFTGRWFTVDARVPDAIPVEVLRGADVLAIALPEGVAIAALDAVASSLGSGALVVDTVSVMAPLVGWAEANRRPVGVLGINPLFAPDLGFSGRLVAAVSVSPGGDQPGVLGLLRAAGAHVLEMGADEHDRDVAATQVLTHAVVLALGRALYRQRGGIRRRTETPPHRVLVMLLARILSGTPAVYWEVQHANPHAGHARRLLADGVRELEELVAADDEAAFVRLLDELRGSIGGDLGDLAGDAATLLAAIEVSATRR